MKFVPHKNGKDWDKILHSKLWSNQQAALKVVSDYFDSTSLQQALVRMPTGTGKTAVISVVAQLASQFPRVLVVAPWDHLAGQLRREIGERFWSKAGLADAVSFRPVTQFTPSTLPGILKKHKSSGVLICTTQTLERLHTVKPSLFTKLINWVTAVLVDEGHREPAPKWAQAVRALQAKVVLFTATPYRNDQRCFDVDPNFRYAFTFPEAVTTRTVRSVQFVSDNWPKTGAESIDLFVEKLRTFHSDQVKKLRCRKEDCKVIVRCEKYEEVRAVTEVLLRYGEDALGVHERFNSRLNPHTHKSVPDPEKNSAVFWVHQYKLMEGLDDPRFRILAIFSPFRNARNLVQQIGRVIRNPDHLAGEKAFVFVHYADQQEKRWNDFLSYERSVRERATEGLDEISAADVLREARSRQDSFYFLGDFRHQLSPEDVSDPRGVLLLRRSVRVFRWRRNLEFDVLVSAIERDVSGRDAKFFGDEFHTADTYLRLYELFEPSSIVGDLYLENRLAYVFARRIKDALFFYDSEGALPELINQQCAPIAQEELQRLFPNDASVVREVSLLNGDLGNHAFRRKILGTDSLRIVPPSLSDYIHLCSTATGLVSLGHTSVRRYVGFTRSRVTERAARGIPYDEFILWVGALASIIANPHGQGDTTLERFAVTSHYDGQSAVKHILFDIDVDSIDIDVDAVNRLPATPSLHCEDEELWKVTNGEFTGVLDGRRFMARVFYDDIRNVFLIESEALVHISIEDPESNKIRPLDAYINASQNFRAVLEDGTIYAQGRFFAPQVKLWGTGQKRIELLNIITGIEGLETTQTEKGDGNYRGRGWPSDSVFGVITDFKSQGLFEIAGWRPDVLICNDIGAPEIADFFAFSEKPKRLVMIHGKVASAQSSLSASAFHEVCSQAIRYSGFFNPHDTGSKLSLHQIDSHWSLDGRKCNRICINRHMRSAVDIRGRIDELIRDMGSQREVWIVLGGGLSKQSLQSIATAGRRPPPHVIHLLYLLQSTWTAVASVGASLRVFCKR